MRKAFTSMIALILCLLLTSCQTDYQLEQLQQLHQQYNNTDDIQHINDFDILDSGPEKGGTLKLFTTEPDTLNPILTKNVFVADLLGFVYEGLTRLDERQKAVPVLADRWSVSSDGLIWDFHIRDGVKWHDGQPFTAYDVEFTIETILNPSVDSVYKPLLLNISTCAAVDSSNIRIALKKPNSFMPETMNFPVIPKHNFLSMDVLTASENMDPVGTGPYRFDSYIKNDSIILAINNNWWYLYEDESLTTDGMYLENIQANIFKSADDVMAAFQTGDTDTAGIPVNEYHKYKGRTDLNIKKYTSRDFEFISLNLKDPVFSDVYARKAISLGINKDELISEILPGDAAAAELPVLPGNWLTVSSEGVKEASRDVDKSIGNADNENSNEEYVSKEGNANEKDEAEEIIDLNKARTPEEALTLGGWKTNNQGYYKVIMGARRYLNVELLVNSNNSIRVRAAQIICSQLEKAGIKVKLVQLGWDDMLKRISNGKYDMALIGCRISQIPDISYLYSNSYLPESISKPPSAYNVSKYSNPQVDDYIGMLFKENDEEKRRIIYNELKELVLSDCPYIGLYFLRDTMVYGKDIKGRFAPDTWNRFNDMLRWYKPEIK